MFKKVSQGFTLIELLVVISIIGILAALMLANMVGIRERAADTKAKGNLKQLQNALRLYYNDFQMYPLDSSTDPCFQLLGPLLSPTYISDTAMPDGQFECRYTRTLGGDGFNACIPLQSNGGTEDDNSRDACGITNIQSQMGADGTTTTDQWYCVCAQ